MYKDYMSGYTDCYNRISDIYNNACKADLTYSQFAKMFVSEMKSIKDEMEKEVNNNGSICK